MERSWGSLTSKRFIALGAWACSVHFIFCMKLTFFLRVVLTHVVYLWRLCPCGFMIWWGIEKSRVIPWGTGNVHAKVNMNLYYCNWRAHTCDQNTEWMDQYHSPKAPQIKLPLSYLNILWMLCLTILCHSERLIIMQRSHLLVYECKDDIMFFNHKWLERGGNVLIETIKNYSHVRMQTTDVWVAFETVLQLRVINTGC